LVTSCEGTAFKNTLLKEMWREEVTGRGGRISKQLLDDFKEKRGHWKLKAEALDHTLWETRFGGAYGSVTRKTTE
jgi:hypothetical protein